MKYMDMSNEMVSVRIPLKLISEANNTDHWTKKRKRKKAQQGWIAMLLKPLLDEKTAPPCAVHLTRIAPRKLDYDNLLMSFKGVRDYVASILLNDPHMGRGDSDPRITWIYDQQKGQPKEYGFVITITSATDKYVSQ